MRGRHPYVTEATLVLADGTDADAVGAAVTVALCGDPEHEGGCRWPHNNAVRPADRGTAFRTVFVAPPREEREVRERIDGALRASTRWTLTSSRARALTAEERELAARLARTPPPSAEDA